MIQLRNVTLRRGSEPLLEGSSLTVHAGSRLGLIGANGAGKSTLFALLRGEITVDAGEWSLPTQWTIAHLAQETPGLSTPAIEHVLDGDTRLRQAEAEVSAAEQTGDGERIGHAYASLEAAGGYDARPRASALMHGLGFAAEVQEKPVAAFSGGWRVRLNLARALMCPSDLLLLDEPTNHLDLEAVLWLEQWLKSYTGTLMMIAHDRDFLDAVVTGIVHLEHRQLTAYSGAYSAFERQRAERLAQQQALYERQQRETAHMESFINRFRAKATKARAAQSRLKALERMEQVAPAHVDSPFSFSFPAPPKAGNPLLALDGVSLGHGDTPVLKDIKQTLAPGDRIGLLGPNGAGKSTLVRGLAGTLEPIVGSIQRSPKLAVGYFAQHQLEQLDAAASPVLHLERLGQRASPQRVRDFLGGFGFHGEQALGSVGDFSGGEKARLVLAMLVWQAPNLLLLDEPSNHLDLEMRHALNLALQGFEGAVVVVSHDRYLLETTVADYWLVSGGHVDRFDGDLNAYRQWLAKPAARKAGKPPQKKTAQVSAKAALQPLRRRVDAAVTQMEAIDASINQIEQRLADNALYESARQAELTELLARLAELRRDHHAAETEWMAAEEALISRARDRG